MLASQLASLLAVLAQNCTATSTQSTGGERKMAGVWRSTYSPRPYQIVQRDLAVPPQYAGQFTENLPRERPTNVWAGGFDLASPLRSIRLSVTIRLCSLLCSLPFGCTTRERPAKSSARIAEYFAGSFKEKVSKRRFATSMLRIGRATSIIELLP